MKRRISLLGTYVVGVALAGAGWTSTAALAQTKPSAATDALAQADPVPFWWFHGTVETGGRFFLNNPRTGTPSGNQVGTTVPSLAKYYEYSRIAPGPFGYVNLATGTIDGLYQINFAGINIGYGDQSYYLDASKAGEHYVSLGFDQSPHRYSNTAQTFYQGVGSNSLTLPSGFVKGTTAANIVPFLYETDIGIKRDTASVEYRWTPTTSWDVKADYSHLRRTGTQIDGVTGFGSSAFSSPTQVPKPVSDSTQNFGLNGEYAGTSPWGKNFTLKLAYNGSQYSDDYSAYTIQGPYSNGTISAAQLSLPPSNQANAFSGTVGADLPWKSRYVGTISYNMMRQDSAFIPMTINPAALPAALVLPASSLNGAINTVLSNNVITTKITPEFTSKLSYRYYDFDNNTPELLFPRWVSYDHVTGGLGTESAIRSLSISYVKQNFGEELNWRPTREWNVGIGYGFERYNWTRDSVDVTNEHSGKVFVDWKPAAWFGLRSSGYYSNRQYQTYDYNANVASIQFPGRGPTDTWFVNPAYRQMMTDNRERWKANFAVDFVAVKNLTISPTFKYQDDYYGLNPANQLGLTDSRSWSGGIDATYIFQPGTSIMLGYMREYYTLLAYNINATTNNSVPGPLNEQTNDRTVVDTFTAVGRLAAIPDKLDLMLGYTASRGVDRTNLNLVSGVAPAGGQFPDVSTWFQRLDASAEYRFDRSVTAQLGAKGELKAKLHYAWERNSVANWANDPLAPFTSAVSTTAIWLAGNDPNYNVHLLTASLAYKW